MFPLQCEGAAAHLLASGVAGGEPKLILTLVLSDNTVLGRGWFLSGKLQDPTFVPSVLKLPQLVLIKGLFSLYWALGGHLETGTLQLRDFPLFIQLLFPPLGSPPTPSGLPLSGQWTRRSCSSLLLPSCRFPPAFHFVRRYP